MLESLLHRVQERVDGAAAELVPGLLALVRSEPRGFEALVYEPLLCTILQGEKSVEIGGRVARVPAGHSILLRHPLPVVSRITLASSGQPYVALVFRLDLGELGALAAELPPAREAPVRALDVAPTSPWTLDLLSRTVDLVDDPEAVPVLLPLLRRELHLRLLRAGLGAGLRALLAGRGQARPIGQAIRSLPSGRGHRVLVEPSGPSPGGGEARGCRPSRPLRGSQTREVAQFTGYPRIPHLGQCDRLQVRWCPRELLVGEPRVNLDEVARPAVR